MPTTRLNLVEKCGEFIPRNRANMNRLPLYTRGLYALSKQEGKQLFRVVYIGIGTGRAGIRGRLKTHDRRWGKDKWTHFSFFGVWHNIPNIAIEEIESLILHTFRKHKRRGGKTLNLNTRMKSRKLKELSKTNL